MSRLLGAACVAALLSGCASEAPPYAVCGGNVGCLEPAPSCTTVLFTRSDGEDASGSFCSAPCSRDADCPEGGACLVLVGDATETAFCVARCATSANCFAGLTCTQLEGPGAGLSACLP